MKVGELIKLLEQHDPEMRVLVNAYECDFDNPEEIKVVTVEHNPKHQDWEGEWREAEAGEKSVVISRY